MSAIFVQFKSPKSTKASAANTKYITREPATGASSSALYLHNLEHIQGEDYQETRNNLISFAEARLDEEQVRSRNNPRESRTHYRAILSFDRSEDTEKARDLAKDWLQKNFKDARAVVAVHQDKAHHTHCHVWIDARDVNDRKLQINNRQFKNLDKSWAMIYSKEYGEHYLKQHLEKKQETKKFKQEYRKAKEQNRPTPKAPQRQRQNKIKNSIHQERENYGFSQQSRITNDKRAASVRPLVSGRTEQNINPTSKAVNEASRESHAAIQKAHSLYGRFSEVRGRNQRANGQLRNAVQEVEKTHNRLEQVGRTSRGVEKQDRETKDEPNNKRSKRER
jgi:hypothetical protein